VVVERIYAPSEMPTLKTFKISNWHAKIAVKLDSNSEPEVLASMIGSSNLTLPPFSSTHDYPNVECDIYSWNGNKLKGLNLPKTKITLQSLTEYIDYFEDFNINPKDVGIKDYQIVLYNYLKAILSGSKIKL
jgi:hypothetical protein